MRLIDRTVNRSTGWKMFWEYFLIEDNSPAGETSNKAPRTTRREKTVFGQVKRQVGK
jgi:hypothetical protein